MPARSKPGDAAAPASEAQHPLLVCLVAWLVPGAGHFMLGWNRKALVFFGTLAFMYIVGLLLGGRLFPLQMSEPLVFLSAIAQWAVGLLRLTALVGGFGYGDVVAPGYEYGNSFLIVSGLLNALVVLDTYDIATGRRAR